MKAAIYSRYGTADVVQIEEVEKPVSRNHEVLIRVRAASVNPLDEGLIRGGSRLVTGLRRPKVTRLGIDVAGLVEAVGRDVTQFQPGDSVFGACIGDPDASALRVWMPQGAFAEHACAHQSVLVMKPANVTFEQAASAPVAALTALQGLRDKGRIQQGHKVLINGAAGGVGTFAVQMAKSFAANVTGVCSARNVDMVRSIGADCVIDYGKEDFTRSGQRYDLVLDCVGNHSLSACRRVLNPRGTLVMVGAPDDSPVIRALARMLGGMVISRFGTQKMVFFIAKVNQEDLTILREFMATGRVTPVIDKHYRLSELPEAFRYAAEGHSRGKVIVIPDIQNRIHDVQ